MITTTEYVSISDLRDKTANIVKELPKGKKIVLSNNKPVGVFLGVDEYNSLLKLSFPRESATKEDIVSYKTSSHGKDAVDAFEFLDSLEN